MIKIKPVKKNIIEVAKKTSQKNTLSLKMKKNKLSSIELDRVKLILFIYNFL